MVGGGAAVGSPGSASWLRDDEKHGSGHKAREDLDHGFELIVFVWFETG